MDDKRLEERKRKFQSIEHNLTHDKQRMSIRKEKINDFIFSKRLKTFDYEEFTEKELQVDIKTLDIPKSILDEYENEIDKEYIIGELLLENDINKIKYGLRKLRDLEIRIIDNGEIEYDDKIFDRLLFLLFENEDVQIKYEASYCLTKVTYNSLNYCDKLLEIETLQNLLKQTYHSNNHIVNNIFYIFNNVLSQENNMKIRIFESIEIRERAFELFESFEALPTFLKESLTIFLGNIFIENEKYEELNRLNFKYCQIIIPKLFVFLYNNLDKKSEFETNEKYFWENTLKYIYFLSNIDPKDTFNFLMQFNYFDLIFLKDIEFTDEELYKIFRIFSNLFYENDNILQLIQKYSPLIFFEKVLNSQINTTKFKNYVVKELCFALCNFVSETKEQISMVINHSQIPNTLLKIAKTHTSKDLRKEVVIFFKNALNDGSLESREEIYKLNIISFFTDSLTKYENTTIKLESLNGLELLLDYGEEMKMLSLNENLIKKEFELIGLESNIEDLQNHKSGEIQDVANRIISRYWN